MSNQSSPDIVELVIVFVTNVWDKSLLLKFRDQFSNLSRDPKASQTIVDNMILNILNCIAFVLPLETP
jgi:hypothetical protein